MWFLQLVFNLYYVNVHDFILENVFKLTVGIFVPYIANGLQFPKSLFLAQML